MKTEQQKNNGGLGTVSAAELFLTGQNWETINSNKPTKTKTNKQIVIRNKQKVMKREKKNCDPDMIRTRNRLIWSQTRYHCATESTDNGNANNVFLNVHN